MARARGRALSLNRAGAESDLGVARSRRTARSGNPDRRSVDSGGHRHSHGRGRPFPAADRIDRKSTRLNSSHLVISYAVFCLKKKKNTNTALATPDHTTESIQ